MEYPPYTANPPHHRASLLTNLKYWQQGRALMGRTGWGWHQQASAQALEARMRRDLYSLNGMAGVW